MRHYNENIQNTNFNVIFKNLLSHELCFWHMCLNFKREKNDKEHFSLQIFSVFVCLLSLTWIQNPCRTFLFWIERGRSSSIRGCYSRVTLSLLDVAGMVETTVNWGEFSTKGTVKTLLVVAMWLRKLKVPRSFSFSKGARNPGVMK